MNAGAGLPTGFAVPVLETGSPGPYKTGACSGQGRPHPDLSPGYKLKRPWAIVRSARTGTS